MSAPAHCMRESRPAPLIDRLSARIATVSYLFRYGFLDLESAIDQLQRYAERSGAVRELGTDLCEQIIAAGFDRIEIETADDDFGGDVVQTTVASAFATARGPA